MRTIIETKAGLRRQWGERAEVKIWRYVSLMLLSNHDRFIYKYTKYSFCRCLLVLESDIFL